MRRVVPAIIVTLFIAGAGSRATYSDNIGKTVTWTANPPKIVQGVAAQIILSAPTAVGGTSAGQLNDTFLDYTAVKPAATAQAGFGVAVGTITHSATANSRLA